MFSLLKYTDKKEAIFNVSFRLIKGLLYLAHPLMAAFFLDSILRGDWNSAILIGGLQIVLFFLTQLADFFLDYTEGRVEASLYVNVFKKIDKNIRTFNVFDEESLEATVSGV